LALGAIPAAECVLRQTRDPHVQGALPGTSMVPPSRLAAGVLRVHPSATVHQAKPLIWTAAAADRVAGYARPSYVRVCGALGCQQPTSAGHLAYDDANTMKNREEPRPCFTDTRDQLLTLVRSTCGEHLLSVPPESVDRSFIHLHRVRNVVAFGVAHFPSRAAAGPGAGAKAGASSRSAAAAAAPAGAGIPAPVALVALWVDPPAVEHGDSAASRAPSDAAGAGAGAVANPSGGPGPLVVYRAVLLEALQYWMSSWALLPGQVTASLIQERHVAPMPEGFAFHSFDAKRTEDFAGFALEAPHAPAQPAGAGVGSSALGAAAAAGSGAKRGDRARFVEPEALLVDASCLNPFTNHSEVAAATGIELASVVWQRAMVLVTEAHGEIPVLVGRAAVGKVTGLSMYVAAEVRPSFLGSQVRLAGPLKGLMGAAATGAAGAACSSSSSGTSSSSSSRSAGAGGSAAAVREEATAAVQKWIRNVPEGDRLLLPPQMVRATFFVNKLPGKIPAAVRAATAPALKLDPVAAASAGGVDDADVRLPVALVVPPVPAARDVMVVGLGFSDGAPATSDGDEADEGGPGRRRALRSGAAGAAAGAPPGRSLLGVRPRSQAELGAAGEHSSGEEDTEGEGEEGEGRGAGSSRHQSQPPPGKRRSGSARRTSRGGGRAGNMGAAHAEADGLEGAEKAGAGADGEAAPVEEGCGGQRGRQRGRRGVRKTPTRP